MIFCSPWHHLCSIVSSFKFCSVQYVVFDSFSYIYIKKEQGVYSNNQVLSFSRCVVFLVEFMTGHLTLVLGI